MRKTKHFLHDFWSSNILQCLTNKDPCIFKSYKKKIHLFQTAFCIYLFLLPWHGIFLERKNFPGDIKANLHIAENYLCGTVIKEKEQTGYDKFRNSFKGIVNLNSKENAIEQGLLFSSDVDFVNANIAQVKIITARFDLKVIYQTTGSEKSFAN